MRCMFKIVVIARKDFTTSIMKRQHNLKKKKKGNFVGHICYVM